ncbi:lactase-phlorizin hydrolase-like, partial [Asbolus verrucosus]
MTIVTKLQVQYQFYQKKSFSLASSEWAFPEDFKFGTATSAYQIEGGWNADGKGVSTWDRLTHETPQIIQDQSNGDIACDSYHKWEEDVENIKKTGVDYYRFSLAWTRIFPQGYISHLNQPGVDYYNNLINRLIENGIEPAITLYHWDLPQMFSPLGSWANPVMVDLFANYARKAFELFGDRVKLWITFNEPKIICQDFNGFLGNITAVYPSGVIEYLCTHNLLRAHAEAYHIYDREFRAKQGGKISITLNFEWSEPASDDPADVEAAEQRRQFEFGLFANPIINFDYPKIVKERIAERSQQEGFPQSRLPKFTLAEKLKLRGTYDYLGLNHYSTWYVKAVPDEPIGKPSYEADTGTTRYQDEEWVGSGADWNKVVPWGLRHILQWIKKTYRNPEVLITECGYPDRTGTVDDQPRISFLRDYLNATLQAIHEDGVNVKAFMVWSLMDNFEWQQGYQIKFGIFHVDFNDPERTRTAKKSIYRLTKSHEWRFPDDFKFGLATSAYQIEGAWNVDGKGVSIWDTFTHNRSFLIKDGSNGDIACDSYHKWEEDVMMAKNLGAQVFRISLSWTRILPDGYGTRINQAGVDYYNKLIDKLLENQIEPVFTLYHWDLPEVFSPLGGWTNPALIDYFAIYARTAFALFGDRVKTWITFNDARLICQTYKGLVGDITSVYPLGVIEY